MQVGSGQISSEAYKVLKQQGTERPFTSPLLQEEREGTFACAVQSPRTQNHTVQRLLCSPWNHPPLTMWSVYEARFPGLGFPGLGLTEI